MKKTIISKQNNNLSFPNINKINLNNLKEPRMNNKIKPLNNTKLENEKIDFDKIDYKKIINNEPIVENNGKVLILQTCDGIVYKSMLDSTESIHREYSIKHNYDYLRWDGIKMPIDDKEKYPFLSTFNRLYLLNELLETNEYQWVLYLDADAIIVDHTKSFDEFTKHTNYCILGCRGAYKGTNTWDINAGVAFYNMRHKNIRDIINLWIEKSETYFKNKFDFKKENKKVNFIKGNTKCPNDQDFLHGILKNFPAATKVYDGNERLAFNYEGPFIKQLLRSTSESMEERIQKLLILSEDIIR